MTLTLVELELTWPGPCAEDAESISSLLDPYSAPMILDEREYIHYIGILRMYAGLTIHKVVIAQQSPMMHGCEIEWCSTWQARTESM
jgi:hypothetical protein